MMHRAWDYDLVKFTPFAALEKEHNDLFDAWRKAETRVMETMDENNRLDRELDEVRGDRDNAVKNAMDRLPDAPWKDKTATEAVWLLSLALTPIRVPFSDAQIERMAEACRADLIPEEGWDDANKPRKRTAIRAALAAGGLEPCAVPEDVALRPHYLRVTRDEIASVIESFHSHKDIHTGNEADAIMALLASKSTCMVDAERASDEELDDLAQNAWKTDSGKNAAIRAVRARVEAPLLAEITELRERCGRFDGSAQCLSKTVDDLSHQLSIAKQRLSAAQAEIERLDIENRDRAFYVAEFAAVSHERDAARAELAAVKAERDGLQKRNNIQAGQLRHIDGEISPLMSEVARLKQELTALRPWLREPTGWELDVTAEQIIATSKEAHDRCCETEDGINKSDWEVACAVLDLCRSRIRPTFECKECANRTRVADAAIRNAVDGIEAYLRDARAALEGE